MAVSRLAALTVIFATFAAAQTYQQLRTVEGERCNSIDFMHDTITIGTCYADNDTVPAFFNCKPTCTQVLMLSQYVQEAVAYHRINDSEFQVVYALRNGAYQPYRCVVTESEGVGCTLEYPAIAEPGVSVVSVFNQRMYGIADGGAVVTVHDCILGGTCSIVTTIRGGGANHFGLAKSVISMYQVEVHISDPGCNNYQGCHTVYGCHQPGQAPSCQFITNVVISSGATVGLGASASIVALGTIPLNGELIFLGGPLYTCRGGATCGVVYEVIYQVGQYSIYSSVTGPTSACVNNNCGWGESVSAGKSWMAIGAPRANMGEGLVAVVEVLPSYSLEVRYSANPRSASSALFGTKVVMPANPVVTGRLIGVTAGSVSNATAWVVSF